MLVHRPSQSTSLRQQTTAHMAQTMSLLELTSAELRQHIETELANNPALELLDEIRCPTCGRQLRNKGLCPVCFKPEEASPDSPLVYFSNRDEFFASHNNKQYSEEERSPEEYTAETPSLAEYVLRQIAPDLTRSEQLTAAFILNSLDKDGLLDIPLVEIARYHHISLNQVNSILNIIQHADPLGVGSPNSQQAMLIQLEVLGESVEVPPLANKVIACGLNLLSHFRYTELAHVLEISVNEVKEIAQFISKNLNPYPARAHWGDGKVLNHGREISNEVYYAPDVIISKLNDRSDSSLVVEIAMPVSGTLRVNPMFKESIQEAPSDKTEEWKADLEQAALLVKCIQQRNNTMVRMLQMLAKIQRDYILHGDEQLQPLTRASLAEALGLHESTISRAVADKAIQLPNGHITPLSKFFDRSLHIRTALKQIIEKESKPLSDTVIAGLLSCQGYLVARRTVAKYRSMEGILPAHLRRKKI